MNDADRILRYLAAKRALMMAALAYAESPSEGQAYILRVASKAFAETRTKMRIDTPVLEEP